MHRYGDNRPVFKSGEMNRTFENCVFFYCKFSMDCPVCLSQHESPRIIPCGHVFCQHCLDGLNAFTAHCPICNAHFRASKPAKFFFCEEITKHILFKRLSPGEVNYEPHSGFFENPYRFYYYEPSGDTGASETQSVLFEESSNTCDLSSHFFYQSVDGQSYFLNPRVYKNYKSFPEYIYGRIKQMSFCKLSETELCELKHIPQNNYVHIVNIHH